MDIQIEAPKHPNFKRLEEFYREKVTNKYAPFEFIKRMEIKVSKEIEETTVKFIVDLERDPVAFVKATDLSEDKAFKAAMQKMDHVVRKYKTKHYHGI